MPNFPRAQNFRFFKFWMDVTENIGVHEMFYDNMSMFLLVDDAHKQEYHHLADYIGYWDECYIYQQSCEEDVAENWVFELDDITLEGSDHEGYISDDGEDTVDGDCEVLKVVQSGNWL